MSAESRMRLVAVVAVGVGIGLACAALSVDVLIPSRLAADLAGYSAAVAARVLFCAQSVLGGPDGNRT